MQYRLKVTGADKIAAKLKATPAQVRKASRSTVRQVVNELHRELGGIIPSHAGTPIGSFRKHRARKTTPKGRQRSSRGSVWLGTNKIAAAYVGRLREDPDAGGAWAGQYFFENGFIRKMRSGHVGIFTRVAGSRKIKQEDVELPDARNDAELAANRAQLRLRRILRQRLQIELDKVK